MLLKAARRGAYVCRLKWRFVSSMTLQFGTRASLFYFLRPVFAYPDWTSCFSLHV